MDSQGEHVEPNDGESRWKLVVNCLRYLPLHLQVLLHRHLLLKRIKNFVMILANGLKKKDFETLSIVHDFGLSVKRKILKKLSNVHIDHTSKRTYLN